MHTAANIYSSNNGILDKVSCHEYVPVQPYLPDILLKVNRHDPRSIRGSILSTRFPCSSCRAASSVGHGDFGGGGELGESSIISILSIFHQLAPFVSHSVFEDLGCGGGKVLMYAQAAFPEIHYYVGIECQALLVNHVRKRCHGKDRLYIAHSDILHLTS